MEVFFARFFKHPNSDAALRNYDDSPFDPQERTPFMNRDYPSIKYSGFEIGRPFSGSIYYQDPTTISSIVSPWFNPNSPTYLGTFSDVENYSPWNFEARLLCRQIVVKYDDSSRVYF